MKNKKIWICIIIAAVLIAVVVGVVIAITSQHGDNNPIDTDSSASTDANEKVSVTFDSNGGTAVKPQSIRKGRYAYQPNDPTKYGYDFSYWTLDGEEFSFSQNVNNDIKLVAV